MFDSVQIPMFASLPGGGGEIITSEVLLFLISMAGFCPYSSSFHREEDSALGNICLAFIGDYSMSVLNYSMCVQIFLVKMSNSIRNLISFVFCTLFCVFYQVEWYASNFF